MSIVFDLISALIAMPSARKFTDEELTNQIAISQRQLIDLVGYPILFPSITHAYWLGRMGAFQFELSNRRVSGSTPACTAKWFIYLFVPAEKRDRFLAHFEEEFEAVVEQRGLRRARCWYWNEIFRAIIPQTRKRIEGWFTRTRPVSISGKGEHHD